jgi:hypothetical protein
MLLHNGSDNGASLMLIEGGLTLIAFGVAFAGPRLGNSFFNRIESAFRRLAQKRTLAVATVGFCTLLLRVALLPAFPAPLPFATGDFSNLLAADTFSHGRLTNPTPAMWTHFETIHVDMQPTYMSMYFPGEGLVLAAGKVLFGNPWIGILFTSALMCAAICWMLQAWLPAGWALLGGFIAMLRLGLFSYWVNTYTGAGLISALGGALVLGALPRLIKSLRLRDGLLMAVGIVLLAITRPYEGLLLCLPVAFALGRWAFFSHARPPVSILIRRAALPLLLVVAGAVWMGYYNHRVFGSATTLPYTINRATYAMAPYFVWQSARPEPHYRHPEMRRFYYESELKAFNKVNSWPKFLPSLISKAVVATLFFAGFALLPPLIMIRRTLLDRRIRFLVISLLVFAAGMAIEIFMIPHYLAPFTAVFYAIGLQAMRHLRVWTPEGRPAGRALVRLIAALCVVLAGVRVFAGPLHLASPEWPPSGWDGMWYGPEHFGAERAQIETQLENLPGPQLVLVRYSPDHNPLDQWVYNRADIDASKVVWAWDMGASDNRELTAYYRDRKAWLVEPDTSPITLRPYPASGK